MVGVEVDVAAQVGVDWHAVRVEIVTDLQADPDGGGFEAAERWRLAPVRRQLLVDIADRPDEKLLVQELRRAQVEVRIGSVGVIRGRILEIERDAGGGREFEPARRIEVG